MSENKAKKKIKIPDTYIIVFVIMLAVALLTYLLPAGVYDTFKDEATGVTVVDPQSFHFVDRTPCSFVDFLLSINKGMNKGASIIFFSFLICGYFQILTDTGSLDRSIERMVNAFGNRAFWVIPLVIIIMSVLGASGIVLTPVVALIPIGLALAKRLNLNPVFGVAIFYSAVYAGFGSSPFSPYSVVLAQNIAGVPALSGFSYRAVIWVIITMVTIWYIMRYANKLKKDMNNGIAEIAEFPDTGAGFNSANASVLRDTLVVVALFAGFALYTYGALKFDWGTDYMCGIFLCVGIFSGFVSGMNAEMIVKSFVKGCKSIAYGALLIGFANAISVIMSDGQIMHTIIYYLSLPLTKVAPAISASIMYVINLVFNFFIPSASGKAAIVMPLMAPFADVVGLTRQISVLAYCLADGFGNTVIPTHAILISSISIAGVSFPKWLKFQVPMFLIWSVLAIAFLVISVAISYA